MARDSLSNLSLILRKTGPALNAPGLVAHCCGLSEGSGGDGGVFVGMVGAFGLGEEKVLPYLCQLFEVRCICLGGSPKRWAYLLPSIICNVGV